ncbi:MAG TPA: cytochrome b/b6 domain-containing protein [Gemmatimonadales bacterium]
MAEWQPYEPDLDQLYVVRFTIAARVQHYVLIVTMTVLLITGLPLLIPGIGPRVVEGGFAFRTFAHRLAGAVMIGLSLFHVGWALLTREGRRDFTFMLPTLQDLRDLVHFVRYQLGKVDEPPPYDKFDPFEKFEYLSVVWGTIVMIVTGLTMWFFEFVLRLFPKWVYDVAVLIHGYEAVLAFTAIILLHLYHVHLKPGVFPMSRVWLDGKMSVRHLKEHHPRAYARWLEEQRLQRSRAGAPDPP